MACLAAALQPSYVIIRSHKNHKVNQHIDNLVFVVATALRSCDIAQRRKTAARNPGIYRRKDLTNRTVQQCHFKQPN